MLLSRKQVVAFSTGEIIGKGGRLYITMIFAGTLAERSDVYDEFHYSLYRYIFYSPKGTKHN